MCGVVALYRYGVNGRPIAADELIAIRDAMVNRGPDAAGLWISDDQRVGFGHRRLTIIDLNTRSDQPMAAQENQNRVVFNGEIYNYREFRGELEQRGCIFRTESDTEVLLHAYEQFGSEMVHRLRGMYAFAIWDERRRGLFLARDPFGIKPLYFADDGQNIAVASQLKALRQVCGIDSSPSASGQVSFLLWGFVVEPHTLYPGIRTLPAGSTMWIDAQGARPPSCFWDVSETLRRARLRRADLPRAALEPRAIRELVRESLLKTIRYHMVADVPVGVFLSGGLDSATIVGLASELGYSNLKTLTLGFDELRNTPADEAPYAKILATRYHTDHRTSWIGSEQFSQQRLDLLRAMDQPSVDGTNVYFVSKMAAKAGMKVALSGLGGDELFGSYPSFSQIPPIVSVLRPFSTVPRLGRVLRVVSAPVIKHMASPKYAGLFEYGGTVAGAYLLRRGLFMPWELPEILDPAIVKEGWAALAPMAYLARVSENIFDTRAEVTALEMSVYMRNQLLRDSDWASMAHSLEVRLPFVDSHLLEELAPYLMSDTPLTKQDMVASLAQCLPSEIESRPKVGFTVPIREWMLKDQSASLRPTDRGLRTWAKYVLRAQLGS